MSREERRGEEMGVGGGKKGEVWMGNGFDFVKREGKSVRGEKGDGI